MSHKRKKVSIVGAGFVGSTCAHWIVARNLADVVLIDLNEGLAKGRALDLYSSTPVAGTDISVQGGSDYSLSQDSDIVVITAGLSRRPGMDRADLLSKNAMIMKSICEQLKLATPKSIFIIVSNPLDAMVYLAHKTLEVPRERILGMAGILDTARFKAFIAQKQKVSVKDISALVLGGHGDSMVPLTRFASVGGIPLSDLMSEKDMLALVQRTRKGGGEIVSLMKTGSAYYAPSASVVEMLESILLDQRRILPCAALLQGEYGEQNVFTGVPCQLSGKGLEKVIQISLNAEEQKQFKKSVATVHATVKELNLILAKKD